MSENIKENLLKQCQKCDVDMNGDMLDAQGVCFQCKTETKEEHQKNLKIRRDSTTYNVSEMMEAEPAYADFISCDRSGRRNAIHTLPEAAAIKLEKPANNMNLSVVDEENQEKEAVSETPPGLIPERKNDSSSF